MPELGTKHECFSCGAKFYDLAKPEPICPKCGANQKNAKKQETGHDTVHAKRKKREEVVRIPEVEDEVLAPHDDDFVDEEIETPEGVSAEDEAAVEEDIDDEV